MNIRIYLLALGAFALGTDLFVIAGVLPAIAQDNHVNITIAGLLVTVFSLAYGFGAPTLAALTERVPRRILLMVVLAGFCLANICSAFAPTFSILMATRIIAACFAALYTPTAAATAAALTDQNKRGQALGTVVGGLNMATVLGVPIGTWLGTQTGWRTTFLFVAFLAGLAFILLLIIRIKDISDTPTPGLKARLAPLVQPGLLIALLPIALWSCGGFILYTYITPFLQQYTHIDDPSLMLFIYGAGAVLGSWLGGYLADRYGSMWPILSGLIVLIIAYITLPLTAQSIIGASIALALWGSAGNILFAPQQHRLLGLTPTLPTIILALNSSVLYLGIASGSAIGSLVLAYSSLAILPLASTLLTALSLVCFILSYAKQAQHKQQPDIDSRPGTKQALS